MKNNKNARRYRSAGFLLALWLVAQSAWAQVTEAELKASFILSFARYTTWPAETLAANTGELALCFLGARDELYEALSEKQGKPIQQMTLRFRAVTRGDTLRSCHILVFSDSEAERAEPVLTRLSGQPVLTINGAGRFLDVGGIIGIFPENNKLRFDINLAAARQSGLTISSNLLKLARTVRQ